MPFQFGRLDTLVFFDKLFYPQALQQNLNSSSLSLAKSLFAAGVDIYQVPSQTDLPCRYYDFLQQAPPAAMQNWEKYNSQGGITSYLLGLFTAVYQQNVVNGLTRISQQTILLIDSTQKWTLLHEMSHFLFAQARVTQAHLQLNNTLEKDIKSLKEKMHELEFDFHEQASRTTARQLITVYEEFFHKNFALDKRTALEEFTIEAMLAQYAQSGDIAGIENSGAEHDAKNYMSFNGETVQYSYLVFAGRMKTLKSEAQSKAWSGILNRVNTLIEDIHQQVDFIDKTLQQLAPHRRRRRLGPRDFSPHGQRPRSLQHYNLKSFLNRHQMMRD